MKLNELKKRGKRCAYEAAKFRFKIKPSSGGGTLVKRRVEQLVLSLSQCLSTNALVARYL